MQHANAFKRGSTRGQKCVCAPVCEDVCACLNTDPAVGICHFLNDLGKIVIPILPMIIA